MKLSAADIAELTGGVLTGDYSGYCTGARGLDDAGPGDISFLGNPRYRDRVAGSRAGLVLVPADFPDCGRPLIRVKNPALAFARVLEVLSRERMPLVSSGIHPQAVVSPDAVVAPGASIGACAVIERGARIGAGTSVGPLSYVGPGSVIGADCLIHARVAIREGVRIGDRVIINCGAVIGSDGFGFVPDADGLRKIPQIGGVDIGDDVEIGANTTIDRATTGTTRIGAGTKIDNLVQIAHNVEIGPQCVIVSQVGISGSTRLGRGVTIGGQAGAGGHLVIGDGVTIAARGGAARDIPAGQTVSGFPARPHAQELRLQAVLHKLPEIYARLKKLGVRP